jgi:hypothetical protein
MNHHRSNSGSPAEGSNSGIDTEEFVRQNRREIIAIIRTSDDPFTRACAWALLDKYTPDLDASELHQELDEIIGKGDSG